jgi:glycosyltransferase involved in cell wall biosynthesis
VGWDFVRTLAPHHDLWVITRTDARAEIEAYLAENDFPPVTFVYYELPDWMRPCGFGDARRPTQLYYYLWQYGIRKLAEKVVAENDIDLVHHVTFVKYWAPSFLASLPKPFLWGPVGGGETAPDGFFSSFSWRGRIYELLRDGGRWLGEHDPFVRRTARQATMTLASTRETADRIRRINDGRAVAVYPAIGVTDAELAEGGPHKENAGSRIRIISIGRFLHWKGFHLGLEALARAGLADAEYLLVGGGPERGRLEALARGLGIEKQVRFTGNLPRAEVLTLLQECDMLVHPSLHESGGGVCLEAMAAHLPVIALDLGGPAIHHADGAGITVPAHDPAQTIAALADAMRDLANNPERRIALGDAGYRRLTEQYLWAQKASHYTSIYRSMLGDATGRPAAPKHEPA